MALPNNQWVNASEISIRSMNTMRGKMCSLIEAMALPKDQEEAAITLLKQLSYETQEEVSQLLRILDDGSKQFRYNNKKLEVR